MTMERAPVFSRPLLCFLALVAAILLRGLNDRCGPVTLRIATQRLADGDCERSERLQLLRAVQRLAAGSTDRATMLKAAMAAVALEDAPGYANWEALLGGAPPLQPDDAGFLAAAALGDPVLAALLAAMLAERTRAPDAADRYGQVEASCRLFGLALAGRLAADGRQRVR